KMTREFIANAVRPAVAFAVFLILLTASPVFLPLASRALPQGQSGASKAEKAQAPEEFGYVIEQYETRVRFENDGTSRRERHVRARILSDQGARELSRLAFEYDRQTEQLEISSVKVLKANGGSIEVL